VNTASHSRAAAGSKARSTSGFGGAATLVLAWAAVGLPLAWGVAETLRKTLALFQ